MPRTLREWRKIQNHRNSSPLISAQVRLANFIANDIDEYEDRIFLHNLRGKIVSLSHDVFKSPGSRGHKIRQKVRKILWDYSKRELERYDSNLNLNDHRPPYEESVYASIVRQIKSLLKRIFG